MSESSVDQVSDKMGTIALDRNGVSFKGKSLKLDKEEDCCDIVAGIDKCQNLEYLNLEGNTLGVEGSKAIAKALSKKSELKRALWKDMFTGRMKEEIPKALLNLGSALTLSGARLTELELSDNAFGPIGVEGLAGLLSSKTCYQLQVLRLNNNGLGISGGKMLAAALLQCHKNSKESGKPMALKVFIAGRNRLENEGAKALSKVFKTIGTLEEVALPQNGIYHPGIKALSEAFAQNQNLKIVNLNDNIIGKTGAASLANVLPNLQKLQVLNLGDCLLKTDGAKVLAQALTDAHLDLEELHMSYNEIGSSGGLVIANAMKNKDKLKILTLNGNQFGESGCDELKEELSKHNRIEALDDLGEDEGEQEIDEENSEENEEENKDSITGDDSETQTPISSPKSTGDSDVLNHCIQKMSLRDSLNNEANSNFSSPITDKFRDIKSATEASKTNQDQNDNFAAKGISFTSTTSSLIPPGKLNFLSNPFQNKYKLDKDFTPVTNFLKNPTVDNFNGLSKELVMEYVEQNQKSSPEFYTDTLIPLIIKISSLSASNKENVKFRSADLAQDLYKKLFSWATQNNQLSAVNNSLTVYLGLIKSEDKKFQINWNIDGCLLVLRSIISKALVPKSTEDILECCLTKKKKESTISTVTLS